MIIENYLQSEPDLYNAENYKTLDNKIKNWDGCDFEAPQKILCKRFSTKSRISRFQSAW